MIAASRYDGYIAGLRASSTFGGLRFSFRHVGIVEEQRFRYAVVLDGELTMLLQDAEFNGRIDGVTPGVHRLEIIPLRDDVRRIPDFHGHQYGRKAFLVWPSVADEDLRGYQIFGDGGSGTVDYDTPLATVSRMVVTPRWGSPPDTGTGVGRLTVGGIWTRDAINKTFHVRASGPGKFQHDIAGDWSSELEWLPQLSNYLPGGIVVAFEDLATAYEAGDSWEIKVGPISYWGGGELPEGTYLFAVKSLDAAGNASADATTERAIVIIHKPNDVTGASVEFAAGDIGLAWTLPADDDLASILIYSNFSRLFGRLQESVIETGPWMELAGDETDYVFTPAVAGVWQFVIRTKDVAGRISESIKIVDVDTTGLPDGVQLNVPENVIVTPIADGLLRVTWSYAISGGLDASSFAIYRNTDPEAPVFDDPEDVVIWELLEAQGEIITLSQDLGPETTPVYFTVRARSAGGLETSNTDLHLGTPDAGPPATPAKLNAVAN